MDVQVAVDTEVLAAVRTGVNLGGGKMEGKGKSTKRSVVSEKLCIPLQLPSLTPPPPPPPCMARRNSKDKDTRWKKKCREKQVESKSNRNVLHSKPYKNTHIDQQ